MDLNKTGCLTCSKIIEYADDLILNWSEAGGVLHGWVHVGKHTSSHHYILDWQGNNNTFVAASCRNMEDVKDDIDTFKDLILDNLTSNTA